MGGFFLANLSKVLHIQNINNLKINIDSLFYKAFLFYNQTNNLISEKNPFLKMQLSTKSWRKQNETIENSVCLQNK